ncbi:MAG: prepilin-type N-terminal cleavage/methylation domain-containing protein [Verrucomicrobiota bacterium]
MKNKKSNVLKAGFSLVEMLVVIAIIGIIAAIAVPKISDLTGNAQTATDKRNAQTIASVYSTATAAGAVGTIADLSAAVLGVSAGFTAPTDGAFAGETFGVPGLSDEDLTAATAYLTFADGILSYQEAAGSTTTITTP